MKAIIWKVIDGHDYFYGKYNFETMVERCYVNELAEQIRRKEGVQTWVERIEE